MDKCTYIELFENETEPFSDQVVSIVLINLLHHWHERRNTHAASNVLIHRIPSN